MNNIIYELRELVIIPEEFKEDLRLPIIAKLTNDKEFKDSEFINLIEKINQEIMEQDKRNNKRMYDVVKISNVNIEPKWFDLDYLESFYYDKWLRDFTVEEEVELYIQRKIDEKYKFFNIMKIINELQINYGFNLLDISCTHEEIIY